jgi:8-oxo-dGTP pyrophosphatase MutT (NUDIX family)
MGTDLSARFLRAARLPKEPLKQGSRERQEVAAVCYRKGKRRIEFLLVQTRGGRWIFPKGGVEAGLTQAQSAALEAMEEAGVHGRMEELPFARYFRHRPETVRALDRSSDRRSDRRSDRSADQSSGRTPESEHGVAAHLCEVTRLEPPQEANRNPTWFSTEKAKQRLQKDRAREFGAELVRVIDRAVSRIQRLHASERAIPDRMRRDGLQEVRFEASECGRFHHDLREAVFARYLLRRQNGRSFAAIDGTRVHRRKVQQIAEPEEVSRPVLRLGTGGGFSVDAGSNLTAIDAGPREVIKPVKPRE